MELCAHVAPHAAFERPVKDTRPAFQVTVLICVKRVPLPIPLEAILAVEGRRIIHAKGEALAGRSRIRRRARCGAGAPPAPGCLDPAAARGRARGRVAGQDRARPLRPRSGCGRRYRYGRDRAPRHPDPATRTHGRSGGLARHRSPPRRGDADPHRRGAGGVGRVVSVSEHRVRLYRERGGRRVDTGGEHCARDIVVGAGSRAPRRAL